MSTPLRWAPLIAAAPLLALTACGSADAGSSSSDPPPEPASAPASPAPGSSAPGSSAPRAPSKPLPDATRPGGAQVAPGQDFTLRRGGTARLKDGTLTVTFESVADSRCPKNATCVWEGDAIVTLQVAGAKGAPAPYKLHTNRRLAASVKAAGHTIRLLDLQPAAAPPAGQDYTARLRIS